MNNLDNVEIIHSQRNFNIFHLFCGSGGGALGFQNAAHVYKGVEGKFKTLGGIDCDPDCCVDFEKLTGVPATCLDLFTREMYEEFWGYPPPETWKEATASDILCASQGVFPDVVFLSPPCKGFSGLLPENASKLPKYQALNKLVVRSMQLTLEAYRYNLPAVILIENVPRIQQRGAKLLQDVKTLLSAFGYEFTSSVHDCGELGGLGQTRKRFLLICRLPSKLQSFIYEPPKIPLRSIGDILKNLPLPDDTESAGAMHRLPRLQWKTWVRLALIPAGKDWRALNQKGFVNHYRIIPVNEPCTTITGAAGPAQGAISIAEPATKYRTPSQLRVTCHYEVAPTVTGSRVGSGAMIVAEKLNYAPRNGTFRVVDWNAAAPTITGANGSGRSSGISAIADPRVLDTRCYYSSISARDSAYGVLSWEQTSPMLPGNYSVDNRPASVADPRNQTEFDVADIFPDDKERGVWKIIAADNTWHRPITTFEMAMLQSLPAKFPDGSPLVLSGSSESKWREHIGNMVPPNAAKAVGIALLETMLPNMVFSEWHWNYEPDACIWVHPKEQGDNEHEKA